MEPKEIDAKLDALIEQLERIRAQQLEWVRRYFILLDFHETALRVWSCSRGGPGNEPCTLNESDDPNEVCMYHLAVKAQEEIRRGQ